MKHTLAIAALISSLTLVACSEATTDEPLPDGTAPNDTQADAEPSEATGADTGESTEPEVPVETSEPETPIEPEPAADAPRTTIPGLSFVMPEGWSAGPAKSMRLLTLLPGEGFGGAELAVSKWPGDVGGFGANVARWAGQAGVSLDPVQLANLPKLAVGDTQATYIPLVNKDTGRAILAMWVPRGDNPDRPTETWTFKLTCSAEQALKLEAPFKAWAASVAFE